MTNQTVCHALDDDGNQCKRKAKGFIKFHGDNEVCAWTKLTWVKVPICKYHLEGTVFDDNVELLTERRNEG